MKQWMIKSPPTHTEVTTRFLFAYLKWLFLFFVDGVNTSKRGNKLNALQRLLGQLLDTAIREDLLHCSDHVTWCVAICDLRQGADVKAVGDHTIVLQNQPAPQHCKLKATKNQPTPQHCKSKATKNQLVPQHCKSKVTKKNQPAHQHCKSKATKNQLAPQHCKSKVTNKSACASALQIESNKEVHRCFACTLHAIGWLWKFCSN